MDELLSLSERDVLELIPKTSGLYFVNCANCHSGTQEQSPFAWDIHQPDKMVCKACGQVYPDPAFPEEGVIELNNSIEYRYYEDDEGKRYFFQGRLWDLKRRYLVSKAREFAEGYDLTGREDLARRSGLILYGFARTFPGWALHFELPYRPKEFWSYNEGPSPVPRYKSWRICKWTWWDYLGVDTDLIEAYKFIAGSQALKDLADDYNVDIHKAIREDLFGQMVEHAMRNEEYYSNMSPVFWKSVVRAAEAMEEPRYIEEMAQRFTFFMENRFQYDGFWFENTPSYHNQTVGTLKTFLRSMEEVSRSLGLKALPLKGQDLLREAEMAVEKLRLPNGRYAPTNDTWHHSRGEPLDSSRPQLLPSMGYAILGQGKGECQVQAHLAFTGGYHHKHRDHLNLLLFAFGKEMLSDIGYTHTKERAWSISTAAHNTVIIDGKDQEIDGEHKGISLKAFGRADHAFQVVSASSSSAYPQVSQYHRHVLMIGAGNGESYILDLFRVLGGDVADYIFHGDADEDSDICHSLGEGHRANLLESSESFKRPEGEHDYSPIQKGTSYGFIEDTRALNAQGPFNLDLKYPSITPSLRIHFPLPEENQVILGKDPSIRGAGENDLNLHMHRRPVILLRKEGAPVDTLFCSVLEPYEEKPFIDTIRVLKKEGGFLSLEVTRAGVVDLLMADVGPFPRHHEFLLTDGVSASFEGRYAMARIYPEGAVELYSLGAEEVTIGQYSIKGPGHIEGQIIGACRDERYFLASGSCPEGLEGHTLILIDDDGRGNGFTVKETKGEPGGIFRIYVEEDPGFCERDGTLERVTAPQRHFVTWPKYRIYIQRKLNFLLDERRISKFYGENDPKKG